MPLRTLFLSLFALTVLALSPASAADRRVALVVGNDAYQNVPGLQKAVADARAMGERLRKLGFEVIARENAPRAAMTAALQEFTARVEGAEVGLVFYAGHGVQVDGRNILLPTDIPVPASPAALIDDGIDLGRVLERLADSRVRFAALVIDACRDNPFPRRDSRSVGGTRGLTIPAAPRGVYIAYSAGVNEQALDRLGPTDDNPNGVFTRNLLAQLEQPASFDAIVKRARDQVRAQAASVGHAQNPAIYDQTTGDFYLSPTAATRTAQASGAASTQADPASEGLLWQGALKADTRAGYAAYIAQFCPGGQFCDVAGENLRRFEGGPTVRRLGRTEPDPAAEAVLQKAEAAYEAKNYAEALRLFHLAASQGHGGGMAGVGRLYATGNGVPLNQPEALRWFLMAAEQGDPRAQYTVALAYENGIGVDESPAQAAQWYAKAAAQGDAWSQRNLGRMHAEGRGVKRDPAEAARLYKVAADQGDAAAQYYLGAALEVGEGVPADPAEAARLYAQAAAQGDVRAQRGLGAAYASGKGVDQDFLKAASWLGKAAAQGDGAAQSQLDRLYASRSPGQAGTTPAPAR